jgi:hypothetical protein
LATSRKSGCQIVRNRRNPNRLRYRIDGPRPGFPAAILGESGLPLLRTSERSTFKRCHFKWWLEFHELVKPTIDVPPLRFGSLRHESLARYYIPGRKRGVLPAKSIDLLYARDLTDAAGQTTNYATPEIDPNRSQHRDLGIDKLEMYVER